MAIEQFWRRRQTTLADMNASDIDREQKSFDAIPTSARAARQFVTDTLRSHGATPKVIGDYALVVSELTTNIIEHGNRSSLIIFVDVADTDWWEVEVVGGAETPSRQLLRPDTWTVAGADEASGRGLGIVRHLMDEISSDVTGGQIGIRCRRRRAEATSSL
jgi:anti-sigma regulatory factor (Ser/Thr protein kinase)